MQCFCLPGDFKFSPLLHDKMLHQSFNSTLLLLLFIHGIDGTSAPKPTPIYIDVVPGYKNLSTCAQAPLSSLVRGMQNGCGDGSDLTSYSCFCTDSYSKFSWDISTAVGANCGPSPNAQAQITSAVGVFEEYCAHGTTQLETAPALLTTTGGSATSSRSDLGSTFLL